LENDKFNGIIEKYISYYFSGLMSSQIINPIGPRKKTRINTKHPDLPLSDASAAAHILQINPIRNHITPPINSPPYN
jgi:hypothetical protein